MRWSFGCIWCGARLKTADMRNCPECGRAVLRSIGERFELREARSIGPEKLSFAGYDRKLKIRVFLRVLLPTASKSTLDQLSREAGFLRDSKPHDPFPRFCDAGRVRETGGAYLAVELVEGATADRVLRKLKDTGIARMFRSILGVLSAVHDRGYVYANVHPRHFVMGRDGALRLVDFFHIQESGVYGVRCGAKGFQAPEQVFGLEPLSPATDVFVTGMWLFHELVGKWPYPGRKLMSPRYRLKPASSRSHRITPGLDELLMTALARDADRRFAGAGEMRDALWRCCGAGTVIDDSLPFEPVWRVAASGAAGLGKRILLPLQAAGVFLLLFLLRSGPVVKWLASSMAVIGVAGISLAVWLEYFSHDTAKAETIQPPCQVEQASAVSQVARTVAESSDETEQQSQQSCCYLRFFSWPAARIFIEGVDVCEAPNPNEYSVSLTSRVICFERKDGKGRYEISVSGLVSGHHYTLRVDLEQGKTRLEEK